jgi:IS605 OrfB family transposase
VLGQAKSKAKLVIPMSCSRWHQNKFLNGEAVLRSSLVFKRAERWFIASQFEMPEKQAPPSGAVLGIDRGIVYPVSVGVVDADGALLDLEAPAGNEIGNRIRLSDERRKRQAQRRGVTTLRHEKVVHHSLHRLANEIVRTATRYGAEVAVEKLGEMKKVITTARPTGARKGGWRRSLKKAQLGELEQFLSYKLKLAGLPKVREVIAAGTSMTCPACGHKAKENRPGRDVFKCVACGHAAHADQNASIIIARRAVLMRKLKKGDKLDALHMDMVASLRTRGDGGLGRRELFTMVVPAHVSGVEANEGKASLLTSASGQEVTLVDQNVPTGVLAERIGAYSGRGTPHIREPDQ